MQIHEHSSEIVSSFTYTYGASVEAQLRRDYGTYILLYRAVIGNSSVDVLRNISTSLHTESLVRATTTLLNGIVYQVRFRVEHDVQKDCFTARVRIWQASEQEPQEWTCATACVTIKEQELSVDEVMSQLDDFMQSIRPSEG